MDCATHRQNMHDKYSINLIDTAEFPCLWVFNPGRSMPPSLSRETKVASITSPGLIYAWSLAIVHDSLALNNALTSTFVYSTLKSNLLFDLLSLKPQYFSKFSSSGHLPICPLLGMVIHTIPG